MTGTENDYEEDFNDLEDFPEEESEVLVSQTTVSSQKQPLRIPVKRTNGVPRVPAKKEPAYVTASKGPSNTSNMSREISKRYLGTTASRNPKLPPLRMTKTEAGRRGNDVMAERMLSAKARRVHDLENERNILRKQTDELKQEVRTLNQMLRRQGRALGQYESKDERFPSLLQQSEEEVRITREQLRTTRQKYAQLREQYRQLENYSQTVEKEREKMANLVRDRELMDSKALKQDRDNLLNQIANLEARSKDTDRRFIHAQRAQAQERQSYEARLKDYTKRIEELDAENFVLKQRLGTKIQEEPQTKPPPRPALRSRSKRDDERSRTIEPSRSLSQERELSSLDSDERALQKLESSIMRRVKPSFLKEFRYATTIPENPLSGREDNESSSHESAATPTPQKSKEKLPSPPSAPVTGWKSRTSPDLLKDHDERLVHDTSPSGPSSQASTGLSDEPDRKVTFRSEPQSVESTRYPEAKPVPSSKSAPFDGFTEGVDSLVRASLPPGMPPISKDASLKNDLLERIRLLDLNKKEGSEKNSADTASSEDTTASLRTNQGHPRRTGLLDNYSQGDGFVAPVQKSVDMRYPLHVSGWQGRSVQDDDDIEEIEFF